jgi:hypothetical protein
MATLTPNPPSLAGVNGNMVAVSSSDVVQNPKGNAIIRVKNADASPHTLTIHPGSSFTTRQGDGTYPNINTPDIVVVVAAGAEMYIGPIPRAYNDANGNVVTNWSATTSVTMDVLQP